MRLGVAFWSGVNVAHPDRAVARLDAVGVRGTVLVPGQEGWSDAELERVRKCFEASRVFVAEVAQYRHGFLATHDNKQRGEGIKTVVKSLRDAQLLKAHCVGISRPWGGDGEWWSEKTWTQLCSSLGEIAPEAEGLGVDLAIHPTNEGPLDTAEQLRRVVDDVGSPRLKVMLDPVNMSTHRSCYNTTDFLNSMFDLLGDAIIGAHAKDVGLDTSHWVLRLDEVPLGTGLLDYETYLRRLEELDGNTVLIIEHYRDVGVSGATISPNYVYYDTEVENSRARKYIEAVGRRVNATFN